MGIMLQTPKILTKKILGDRAFLAAASKLWNGLPSQIRNEPNFNRFKGLLKGAVSRNSAKLGNYKMPVELRET